VKDDQNLPEKEDLTGQGSEAEKEEHPGHWCVEFPSEGFASDGSRIRPREALPTRREDYGKSIYTPSSGFRVWHAGC
jgi:hypothetical protein